MIMAMNDHIDAAILQLAHTGRISAISCMTSSENWPQAAQKLLPLIGKVDIGLHFNLTEAPLLCSDQKARSFSSLALTTHLHALSKDATAKELAAQWQSFIDQLQIRPDFIDGHQHIHALPQVRHVVLQHLNRHDPEKTSYLRIPARMSISESIGGSWRQFVLTLLGAAKLRREVEQSARPHNSSFAGMYDFKEKDYQSVMRRALKKTQAGGIILCHPAMLLSDLEKIDPAEQAPQLPYLTATYNHPNDPIASARLREWKYLKSKQFTEDCAVFNLKPMRMRQCRSSS